MSVKKNTNMYLRLVIIAALSASLASGITYAATKANQPGTRIEADQRTGRLHVFSGGKDVAYFDEKGLHVRESVLAGGAFSNVGRENYGR